MARQPERVATQEPATAWKARDRSIRRRAVDGNLDRGERGGAADEEAVPLGAAEADVGDLFRHRHLFRMAAMER